MEQLQDSTTQILHLRVDASGRMMIPSSLRRMMDVDGGGTLIGVMSGRGLTLQSRQAALRQAQEYFVSLAPKERVLSEELIRERREEAARE